MKNIKVEYQKQEKLRDGIYGFIVGDALGVPVEFKTRQMLDREPVKDMREYGAYSQPKGTWSDDSSMTLCTYDMIMNSKDYRYLMDSFLKWYEEGYMTPHGRCFGVGNTTRNALMNYRDGKEVLECGLKGERDNGNGSLMRILPLAYFRDDLLDDKMKRIEEFSKLTHAHKRSLIGCAFYVIFATNLIDGVDKYEAYHKSIDVIKQYYRDSEELKHYDRVLNGQLQELSREEIQSSGYIVDTLEASIWCLLTTGSYKACVLKAVNLGDDTDTIAAVSGGLAGIVYGKQAIPSTWLHSLQNKELIDEVLNNLN